MFLFWLVVLAQFACSAVWADIPQYRSGHWLLNDNPQYETERETPLEEMPPEGTMLPENFTDTVTPLPTIDDQTFQTTEESYLVLGQDSSEVHDSKVWKIVLVTAILLVTLVGSLGTAYYLCFWRGGRIHYQPQRTYT